MRFVTPFLPEPPVVGAIQRTGHVWRALKRIGDVDLLFVKWQVDLSPTEERVIAGLDGEVSVFEPLEWKRPPWVRGLRRLNSRMGDFAYARRGEWRE